MTTNTYVEVSSPIIRKIDDNIDALNRLETELATSDSEDKVLITEFPTVYIHNWNDSGEYEVYVGESNDVFKRTRQHYDEILAIDKWQNELAKHNASLYIIGHEHFNKCKCQYKNVGKVENKNVGFSTYSSVA